MKIALIGGTGKSGKYLVKQLLSQGFYLKALIRNPENFQINSPLIEIVKGDAGDYKSVYSLVKGCEAVISTLGLGKPASKKSIFSHTTKNVIQAMNKCNVQRYILTTGLNVDTPFDKKSVKTKLATDWMKTHYPETTADKQTEYNILCASNVSWTLVRLPLIEQTDEKSEIKVSIENCLGDKISSTSLAHFLIGQLSDNAFVNKSPFIANA